MAANPMHQFNVYRIGPEIKINNIDISFTNASLFMVISSLAILIIFNLGTKRSIIPNKIQLRTPDLDLIMVDANSKSFILSNLLSDMLLPEAIIFVGSSLPR